MDRRRAGVICRGAICGRCSPIWWRWVTAVLTTESRRRQREAALIADGGTFVPLVFAPGEAFQFDWSEDWAVIGGERMKLKVAQCKLAHSRAFTPRAYRQETHEMLGGVPTRGLYDNMKTAVDRIGRGKARMVNARFNAMTSHYLFEATLCNPASGWEKGQIEKNV